MGSASYERRLLKRRKETEMNDEAEMGDQVCNEADGCPTENAVLKREWRRLTAENAALKYILQLDEDWIGKIQQVISVLASRPEVTPNVGAKAPT
jgi:hypothetical protein